MVGPRGAPEPRGARRERGAAEDRPSCEPRLRAQAAAARPRGRDLRRSLTQVERGIGNYTRAIARGDITSLDTALRAAEERRVALQAELAQLDGNRQPAVVQLISAMLERHLQGMTEKLRSGVNGKVREAIRQSIARIVVGVDGSLTIQAKPGGLLGMEGKHVRLDGEEEGGLNQQSFHSSSDRRWRVTMASM